MCPMQYMPDMQMMNYPGQYTPMMQMPQEELEAMYPQTYNMIYPHVQHQCDSLAAAHGQDYSPTRQQLEGMVDNIYKKVEADVEAGMKNQRSRQFGFGGRRLLRDLIGILLIRELLQRRRPFPYPYFYGGYPGFYGGFGGYPWY